jgi:hypothetical protein
LELLELNWLLDGIIHNKNIIITKMLIFFIE